MVSGPHGPLDAFQADLEKREMGFRRLHTSHAFHSAMMDPIVDDFAREVERVGLRAPQIPLTSSVTGTWLTDEEARDPRYWASHLRHAVRPLHVVLNGFPNVFEVDRTSKQIVALDLSNANQDATRPSERPNRGF